MSLTEYRPKGTIWAEKVAEDSRIVTVLGPLDVSAGDYLIHTHEGVKVVNGKVFENEYVAVESKPEKDEFHPAGKTVEEVVSYLNDNPDDVDRVIQEERDGASRKGILSYAK